MLMAETKIFQVECEQDVLIVTPLRNLSSLADEDIIAEWETVQQQLTVSGVRHVVFDFHNLKYFGSTMLEVMLLLWKRIRPHEGRLAVCNVSKEAREILRLSRFDTIWPVCDSRDAALGEVNSQPV